LIQVVPYGSQPRFRGGYVVYVEQGDREWVESVRYADVVVLVGGLGGTYETYLFAVQEQRPVFPIAGTGGDARQAFDDILSHWTLLPTDRIDRQLFIRTLDTTIGSREEAARTVDGLFQLIAPPNTTSERGEPHRKTVFLSYSHRDKRWLEKIRTMLRPLERKDLIHLWDDSVIGPGQKWRAALDRAAASASVVVFLVSRNFIASDFIANNELAPIIRTAEERNITIMWLLLSDCLYDETPLRDYQAAHDISKPLDRLTPARQNEELVKVAKQIRRVVTS
jgi:hypothetical protein